MQSKGIVARPLQKVRGATATSDLSSTKMLRISAIESADHGTTLHLEGQLAGPWTTELDRACECALRECRPLTLDLADVSLIDRPGLAFLASLSRRTVAFVRCSPFQEEQLRQAAATHHEATTTLP